MVFENKDLLVIEWLQLQDSERTLRKPLLHPSKPWFDNQYNWQEDLESDIPKKKKVSSSRKKRKYDDEQYELKRYHVRSCNCFS